MSKVPDVIAESSPAPEPTQDQLAKMSSEDFAKLDTPETSPETDAPVSASKEEAPKVVPDSGRDNQEPKDRSETDRRPWKEGRKIGELSAENRRLARENEELRRASSVPKPDTAEGTVEEGFAKYGIDPEKFPTYEAAVAKLSRAIAADEVKARLAEHDSTRNKQQQADSAHAEEQEDWDSFKTAEQEYSKSDKDYANARKAVAEKLDEVFRGSTDRYIDKFIVKSAKPQLIAYLHQNPKDFIELLERPRDSALVYLGKLEARIEASNAKAPRPKTHTSATAPPRDVGGNESVRVHDPDEAFAKGQITYKQLVQELDAAAFKARTGR